MKQFSENFSKRSRLLRVPELGDAPNAELALLEPEHLVERLQQVLHIQNDFFPCFDWAFPPPLLNKFDAPESAAELFAKPSVEPGRYSLYLHIPFCKTLCSFCYYTVLPGKGIEQSDSYVDALVKEMQMYAPSLRDQMCESVYIGGGTPSYLSDEQIQKLFAALQVNFAIEDGAEISMEAAPGTLPQAKSRLLKSLGVNRLSYGIQTLDSELLATMNRYYSVDEAIVELEGALEEIGNVNVDTMYGFENEPADALKNTLVRFHSLGIPSLSIYSLDTQRSTSGKSLLGPPKDEQYREKIRRFAEADELLTGFGYKPVLQNVYAIPGKASYRHQVRRWDNLPLVSLGLASQGYAPQTPYQNVGSIKFYYQHLESGRLPIATVDRLDPELEMIREVSSQLRFTKVDVASIQRKYGVDLDFVFGDLIRSLTELGYLQRHGDELSMTSEAAYYNNLIPMLFAPDAFKERLLALPEEYLADYPVPFVMTQVGCTQSAAIDVRLPG
jgi:oxygen-independent coproporphyrinogen-3 oxidase